jgi:hypothetical protein
VNRPNIALFLAVLIAVGVASVSGQAPDKPRMGFLSVFKVGQSVNVKEVAEQFEFSTFDDGLTALSHKVIEVGLDCVTVEDIADVSETRIPVYSIKSFVKQKVPQK